MLGECSVFQILLGEGMEDAIETTDVQRLMAGRGAVNTLRKAMLEQRAAGAPAAVWAAFSVFGVPG